MIDYHRGLVAVVLVLIVVGCGRSSSPRPVEPDHASIEPKYLSASEYSAGRQEQEELLIDGAATKQEYELAAQRYIRCLTTHGLEVRNLGWDPVDGRQLQIHFRSLTKSQDEVDGYGNECLMAHLGRVSELYSTSTTPVMADDLMESMRRCLAAKVIKTTGRERSLPALRASAPDKDREVTDCVVTGMGQLYPDMPATIGG